MALDAKHPAANLQAAGLLEPCLPFLVLLRAAGCLPTLGLSGLSSLKPRFARALNFRLGARIWAKAQSWRCDASSRVIRLDDIAMSEFAGAAGL